MGSDSVRLPPARGLRGRDPTGRRVADIRTALWIVRRYLLARTHGYATFINWVSFIGLTLGVTILTVVLSVMNGFDREITTRILSAVPHALFEFDGAPPMDELDAIDGVGGVSRFFQGEAMMPGIPGVGFVLLAAVDEAGARRLPDLVSRESLERLRAEPGGIVLGAALARALRIEIGDPVVLVVAVPAGKGAGVRAGKGVEVLAGTGAGVRAGKNTGVRAGKGVEVLAGTGAGVRARVERFTFAGAFEIGAEPDATLALVLYADIVRRGLAAAGLDGWRVHLDDPLDAPALVEPIRAVLGTGAELSFWMDDYGELFRAVKIEKAIMFALLALIVAIATLNIVSGQAMLVNSKRGDVAMLTTMGASRRLLVGVFFLQGFSIAFVGVATGLAAGVVIAVNADAVVSVFEGLLGASLIDGTAFEEIPSKVLPADLFAIAGLSLGLSLVAVLRPAFKATAENPAEALHSA